MLSPEVLNFLAVILSRITLSAGDPDFDQTAALIGRARRELLAALEAPPPEAS